MDLKRVERLNIMFDDNKENCKIRVVIGLMDFLLNPAFEENENVHIGKYDDVADINNIISFSVNFSFDAIYTTFKLETKTPIQIFSPSMLDVYIVQDDGTENYIVGGVILNMEISPQITFTYNCASLGWFLTKNIYSPSGIENKLKISPFALFNKFSKGCAGFKFLTDNDDIKTEEKAVKIGGTDTLATVVENVCRENYLYVSNILGSLDMRIVGAFDKAENIGTIDAETDDTPIYNVSAKYSPQDFFSNYICISNSSERQLSHFYEYEYSNAPFFSIKLLQAPLENLAVAVAEELIKAAIKSCVISFSVPDYKLFGKIIQTCTAFNFNSPKHGLTNKELFLTDVNINFKEGFVSSNITACLNAAREGSL